MRLLIAIGFLAFSVVHASAQTPAAGKKMDKGTCITKVQNSGSYTRGNGTPRGGFGQAVARCMKGQPI